MLAHLEAGAKAEAGSGAGPRPTSSTTAVRGARAPVRRRRRRLRRRAEVSPRDAARVPHPPLAAHGRAGRARHDRDDAREDGGWRHVRPGRRRLPPLLGGRALARAALREDALRQRACSRGCICSPSARSAAPDHARVARETLDYLLAEMTPSEGGFFAAQDADSERRGGHLLRLEPGLARGGRGQRGRPRRRGPVRRDRGAATSRTARRCSRSSGASPELAAEFGRSEDEIVAPPLRGAAQDVRRPVAAREARNRRQAPDRLDRARDLGLRAGGARARRAAYEAGRAARRRPDPSHLRPGRRAPPPREGRAGGHPRLRDRLRLSRRGPPRPLRGDLRDALLRRGGAAPGGLRRPIRRPPRRILPLGRRLTTA